MIFNVNMRPWSIYCLIFSISTSSQVVWPIPFIHSSTLTHKCLICVMLWWYLHFWLYFFRLFFFYFISESMINPLMSLHNISKCRWNSVGTGHACRWLLNMKLSHQWNKWQDITISPFLSHTVVIANSQASCNGFSWRTSAGGLKVVALIRSNYLDKKQLSW